MSLWLQIYRSAEVSAGMDAVALDQSFEEAAAMDFFTLLPEALRRA